MPFWFFSVLGWQNYNLRRCHYYLSIWAQFGFSDLKKNTKKEFSLIIFVTFVSQLWNFLHNDNVSSVVEKFNGELKLVRFFKKGVLKSTFKVNFYCQESFKSFWKRLWFMNISLENIYCHFLKVKFLKSCPIFIYPSFILIISSFYYVHFGQKSNLVLIHYGRKFITEPTLMQNPYLIN